MAMYTNDVNAFYIHFVFYIYNHGSTFMRKIYIIQPLKEKDAYL